MTYGRWTGVSFVEARAADDGSVSAVQFIWEVADEGVAERLREQLTGLLGEPEAEQLMDGPAALALKDAADRCGVVTIEAAP